jgi:integrase
VRIGNRLSCCRRPVCQFVCQVSLISGTLVAMRGSITEHRAGWRIWVDAGPDPVTGRRRRLSRVVKGSRKDAERALTALLAEADVGRVRTGEQRTFGEVIDAYLDHKTVSVEPTTAANYRSQLRYIPPRLLAMPVHRVGVEHLEALYAQLATRGATRTGRPLTPKSVRNVHSVIRGALELARRRRWIFVNPAVDAERPADRRRPPSPAPAGSLAELLVAAATEHPALPLYLRVSLVVGGRRSEIHGLRWSGVDFDRSRLLLRDTVVRAGNDLLVKPRLKSGDPRLVYVDAGTMEHLRRHHAVAFDMAMSVGIPLPRDAFVFSDDPDGAQPWRPETTARRFQRSCIAAGLPRTTRLHDLRHLAATWLLDQGVPLPAVSARLGHATNSITLDVYGGRVQDTDRLAAEVMGKLFDPGPK